MKRFAYEDTGPRDLESGRVERVFDAGMAFSTLLDLATSLPLDGGAHAIVRAVISTLNRVLVDRAIGVCLVPPGGDAPILEISLPPGVSAPGRDPTRLFPELADETVVVLDRLPGSTLHVGTLRDRLDDADEQRAIAHAAAILATGTLTAAALSAEKGPADEVARLRAQLIQAEKLASLGQIAAGVMHELANPVTAVAASAEFLLRRAPARQAPAEDVEHLTRIGIAANRILEFSRKLVDYARPAREAPVAVALHDVVAQAHAFTEHELERRGVVFFTDYAEGAPPVLGQAGPLTQLFVNLFTNAAHAMNEHGGRLGVRTRPDGDALIVEVVDTGIGIPADVLEKIFEPFFTTKEHGQGTGLGLSIVHEIAVAHGGNVEAISTLGEGTTFVVRLPLFRR